MNSTQDDTQTITNSNLCPISYEAVRLALTGEAYPMPVRYPMSLVGRDAEVVIKVVNIGIDSRLQACSIENQDTYKLDGKTSRLECFVSPKSLPVLIRRLFEDTDYTGDDGDDRDVGSSLAEDILNTLGFDDTGRFVGRKALGLD